MTVPMQFQPEPVSQSWKADAMTARVPNPAGDGHIDQSGVLIAFTGPTTAHTVFMSEQAFDFFTEKVKEILRVARTGIVTAPANADISKLLGNGHKPR